MRLRSSMEPCLNAGFDSLLHGGLTVCPQCLSDLSATFMHAALLLSSAHTVELACSTLQTARAPVDLPKSYHLTPPPQSYHPTPPQLLYVCFLQGRRDLPQELVNKHPSLQNPDTQLPTTATTLKAEALPGAVIDTSVPPEGNTMQSSSHRIARGNSSSSSSSSSSGTSSPEASPRPSGALPPLPPITGDMKTSDRAVATGSSLGSSQHSSLQSQMQSSTTPSGIMSSSTGATTRAGPPNLARVSISQMSHEALDRTVPGGYLLVTHLGKECATCTSGNTAGHVLTHEQEQLVARAADLEAEQRQHVAAADEAARIAAAAAARAAELEHEIKTEITERKTLLVQQEEVRGRTLRLGLAAEVSGAAVHHQALPHFDLLR